MSNAVKRIKKQMKDLDKVYRNIVNTPFGSLLISVAIMNPKLQMSKYEFTNRFRKCDFVSFGSDISVISNVDVFYGQGTYEKYVKGKNYLALVTSRWNALYMPYIKDGDEKIVLPLDQNGTIPNTLKHALNIVYQEDNKELF